MLTVFRCTPKAIQFYRQFCLTKTEFEPIYRLKHVEKVALINRLKLYQTAVTTVAIPTSGLLYNASLLTFDDVLVTAICGVGCMIPFWCFGYLTNNLIGIIYLNEEKQSLKVSYLDFWGRRKDVVIPCKDIVPFSELPHSIMDRFYYKFKQFSNKETKKLSMPLGVVLNEKLFNKVFL